VSLFNFAYTRDHSFNEPRRSAYPGVEPPFFIIPDMVDVARLRKSSQLIALTPDFGSLPRSLRGQDSAAFRIHVGDCFGEPFAGALLRIESEARFAHRPFGAAVNGHQAKVVIHSGELFPPLSLEALPEPARLIHFAFDPAALRPGYNEIVIFNRWVTSGGGGYRGSIKIVRLEVALYRTASDEFKNRVLRVI
jgi:hypothetical protein